MRTRLLGPCGHPQMAAAAELDHRRNIVMAKLHHGQTSLSLLTLRYLEDEANDRGLNHETSEPF